VHQFGHMLGFKDGCFRSYQGLGADGYAVLKVILSSENIARVRTRTCIFLPACAGLDDNRKRPCTRRCTTNCDRKQSCHPSREPIA